MESLDLFAKEKRKSIYRKPRDGFIHRLPTAAPTYPLVHGLLRFCHTSKNESINAKPESLETRPSSRPSPKVVFEQQRIPPSFPERYLPNDLPTSRRSRKKRPRDETKGGRTRAKKQARKRSVSPSRSPRIRKLRGRGEKKTKETAEFPRRGCES